MKSWINYFSVGRFHLTLGCCTFSLSSPPAAKKKPDFLCNISSSGTAELLRLASFWAEELLCFSPPDGGGGVVVSFPSCEQRWILLYTLQRPSTNNGHPCKVLGLSPHLLNLSPNPTQRNESTGREIACLKLPSRWEKWGLCWV